MRQESAQTIELKSYSILSSIFWVLFLSLIIQVIVGVMAGVALTMSGVDSTEVVKKLESPVLLGVISTLSALAAYPFLSRAVKAVDKMEVWHSLGFKEVDKLTCVKVLVLGAVYYGLMSLVLFLLDIPTPQFMLDLKANTDTLAAGVVVFSAVCVIAPVMEEVIFRGIGFARLINSKVGVVGAILIPSLLFALIHLQYEVVDMLSILPLALLLGYLRYRTDNIWYCILLHFQVNLLSMLLLFTIG